MALYLFIYLFLRHILQNFDKPAPGAFARRLNFCGNQIAKMRTGWCGNEVTSNAINKLFKTICNFFRTSLVQKAAATATKTKATTTTTKKKKC